VERVLQPVLAGVVMAVVGFASSFAVVLAGLRAVGASERLQVDTVGGPLSGGDIFLLASDGLTRLVPMAEIALQLTSHGMDEAADCLIELALDRGAPDNVSLIIVRYRA
jgi:serine/threonine protein phosphatase PrpC